MPSSHPPVNPIVVGLQVGLQVLFVSLLVFAVGMAFTVDGPALAVLLVASLMLLTYAAALLAHSVDGLRRRRILRWMWVFTLTLEWAVLVALTPFAAYLAFPLFFLYLEVLPEPAATLTVGLTTGAAVLALGLHSGWSVGGVIGPVVGAGVAVLIGWTYRALRRESAEYQRLYEELVATQSALATAERERGIAAERARLAREIHDTVAQGLASITLLLNAVERADPSAATLAQVRLARETAAAGLAETRRFIRELTPPVLDEHSLGGALRRLAAQSWDRPGLQIEVRVADAPRLPMQQQSALLRVAQGAMANVLTHSGAAHAVISLTQSPTEVCLEVADDGDGFAPVPVPDPDERGSFGLRTMRERAEQLGGTFEVRSAPGAGTRVRVCIPREAEE